MSCLIPQSGYDGSIKPSVNKTFLSYFLSCSCVNGDPEGDEQGRFRIGGAINVPVLVQVMVDKKYVEKLIERIQMAGYSCRKVRAFWPETVKDVLIYYVNMTVHI